MEREVVKRTYRTRVYYKYLSCAYKINQVMLFCNINVIVLPKKRMWSSGFGLDMCIITCIFVLLVWGLPLSRVDGTVMITRPDPKIHPSREINVTRRMATNPVERGRICGSVDIRNSVRELERQLRGCTVIEGFVQIVLIDRANESDFENISFPELREITCYLMLWRVTGLRNLGLLFPNLAVIRGNMLFKDYALIIYEMLQLQEIGLWGLTAILRGAVRIEKNYALCYYNTVNWDEIANGGENFIKTNKDPGSCPSSGSCDLAEGCNKNMCWGSQTQNCRKVRPRSECHEQCLGGCIGPRADQCFVCRGMLNDGKCVSQCPEGRYSYLGRRCLTEAQCLGLDIIHDIDSHFQKNWYGSVRHNWIPFNGTCINQCPPRYEDVSNGTAVIGCQPCEGRCNHECFGALVTSIADAQYLRGCTTVIGALEISVRGSGNHIVKELEENLASIEEIREYLKISRSFPLTSLSFLKNLRVIHGSKLDEERYSFIVIGNQNLQELWNWTSRPNELQILKGRLKFHDNPKLCLSEIDKLKEISGVPNYTNFDVAQESNGDKVACSVVTLFANATVKSSTSVVIEWDPCILPDPTSVLGYIVYYIEAPEQNITEHDGLDACGYNGWRVIDVPYDSDENSSVLASQQRNLIQFLPHLEPFTQYAFYVKTYTKTNTGGQSEIKYFRTFPDKPSVPKDIQAISNSSNTIILHWLPPEHPNGILTHYLIYGIWQHDDQLYLKQRNYCIHPLIDILNPDKPGIPSSTSNTISSQTCCESAESEPFVLIEDEDEYNMFCGAGSVKKHRIFDDYGEETDPCRNYFYSFIHSGIPELRDERVEYSIDNKFPDLSLSASSPQKALAALNHTFMNGNSGMYEEFLEQVDANTTNIVLKNLHHFAEYTIKIFACHELHPAEPNKNNIIVSQDYERYCGPEGLVTVRTKYLAKADEINSNHLAVETSNETSRIVRLTWKEPKSPNGMVVTYRVEYRRTDNENFLPVFNCLTRQEYLSNGGGYVLKNLPPGNYSFRVKATSLAGEGPYTKMFYFLIEEHLTESSLGSLVGILVGSLLVVAGFTMVTLLWWKKRETERSLMIVANVNPEYISVSGEVRYIEDKWEIPRENVKLLRELGQGSFGMVYEGILRPKDIRCAVKMINENASINGKMQFLTEASMMKSFEGAYHVVNLLGVVSRGQPALVVMELMTLGDLKTYLRSSREPPPPPPDLRRMLLMAAQIADGMSYLEAHKFVHRDLAARNCMVAEDLTVKIGDFGMTRDIYETDYYRNESRGLLPVRWMSPESLADGVFTSQSDVWSFGVVLWEMTTLAEQPYQGLANEQVLQFVLKGGILDRPICCPDVLHQIMISCWQRRPSRRPKFLQIVADLEAVSGLSQNFQTHSFFHSKGGQAIKANMAQQDQDSSCDSTFDETVMSSPPVSFYQLLEDEPSQLSWKSVQPWVLSDHVDTSDNAEDNSEFSSKLRAHAAEDPCSSQLSDNCVIPVTVPNDHNISNDSYVLPGGFMGSSDRYTSIPETPETECLLSNSRLAPKKKHKHSGGNSQSQQFHNSSEFLPHRKTSEASSPARAFLPMVPEDGYVPAENVYIRPEKDTSCSHNECILPEMADDSGREETVARADDSYVPAENTYPRPEVCDLEKSDSHEPDSVLKSKNYVPIRSVNVDSDVASHTQSSRQPVVSDQPRRFSYSANQTSRDSLVPTETVNSQYLSDSSNFQPLPSKLSNAVLEDCSGNVPAENVYQRDCSKSDGDNKRTHKPPNGMVNGYIALPRGKDIGDCVPLFK